MWQQAEDDYRCALAIAENINNTQLQESVRHNLGEMYRRWGRPEDAIELLNSSLEFARQHNDVDGHIITLNNLGLAYRTLSQAQEALTCFNEALELSRRHYRKRDESIVLISLGNFYLLDEQPDKAKHYYESALTVARAAEDTEWEENSILSLAYAHRQLGTFDSIAEDVKVVAEQALALKHYENSIKFLILGGKINLDEDEPESSAEMFEQALLIAFMFMHERLQQIGSRIELSSVAMGLREVVAGICDCIEDVLEKGNIRNAKAMYDSLINKFQRRSKNVSEIITSCLRPVGEYLDKFHE
jgi:tetratricopeptide (TPR) repeat protein